MKLQVLGPGCPNCKKLEANTRQAAEELGLSCEVLKITDINEIISFGVMKTPALALDGTVKITGKVASVEEIKKLLS
jgi:small redox-active disulfide protein 2